ncbi:hypothetical protein BB558_006421 [Smittium angustum]|uniref:Ribosome quality control complex subunit 2 n=1 Tax=Smittium angustum TaxID=133377 RepID=A0A2U1IXS4_SMIAN|nr:hypothetical protein BB558_006421 [Smittium angustum]
MKARFTTVDVRATVSDIRDRVLGLRVQNVYDVNNKTYMLKFTKPGLKVMVIIESGIRIHSTEHVIEKNVIPSQFNVKLRKHLGSRRMTGIRQLGFDRIVDMEFAVAEGPEAEGSYHLISEFYASGNIILTNHKYEILSLIRPVKISDDTIMDVGRVYDISKVVNLEQVSKDQLIENLNNAGSKETLKKCLSRLPCYGGGLAEHVILEAGLNPNLRVASEIDTSQESPSIYMLLQAFEKVYNDLVILGEKPGKGYLVLKKNKDEPKDDEKDSDATEFHPLLLNQIKEKPDSVIKETETFQLAVDEYFGKLDSVKTIHKAKQKENIVKKKLESMKMEQQNRIERLNNQQLEYLKKAELVAANVEYVDQVLLLIRSALAAEIDWDELEELVKQQREEGNPVAKNICGMKLNTNKVTLELFDPDSSEGAKVKIDIDLDLSVFSNVQSYYDLQKSTLSKLERTKAAEDMAFKKAKKKIMGKNNQKLGDVNLDLLLKVGRKPMWFEAFSWFISSDGYLVIGGRDMQQNELLVRKYLKQNDIYVHADTHGATSVVVVNHKSNTDIPISTLIQAGYMAICHSKAWESKIITSAYWVTASQVSKHANTGEYLTTGSFMVRGKKNYLPPSSLVYGFGVLFKVERMDDENNNDENKDAIQVNQFGSQNPEDFEKLREKYNLDLVEQKEELESSKLPSFISIKNKNNIKTENDLDLETLSISEKPNKNLLGKQRKEVKKGKISTESQSVNISKQDVSISETDNSEKHLTEENESKNHSYQNMTYEQYKKIKDKEKNQKANQELNNKTKKPKASGKGKKKQGTGATTGKTQGGHKGGAQNYNTQKTNQQTDGPELDFSVTEESNIVKNEVTEVLSNLIINPDINSPNQILRFAIPVCAPYNALTSYKYKVKLTPGDFKKGKSTKLAKNLFVYSANKQLDVITKKGTKSDSEKEQNAIANAQLELRLLKSLNDNDMVAVMLSGVKVSAPNLEMVKQADKSKKKAAKQAKKSS